MFGLGQKKYASLLATHDDHGEIAGLHGKSFARGWSTSEIAALATQNTTMILVAKQVGARNGRLAGFNIVRSADGEAEILSIAVDPKDRRNGVADMLMREAILRLRAEGQEALLLEVDENNKAAVKLYEKFGFETVGNRPAYYAPRDLPDGAEQTRERAMALVMRLDLV